MRITCREGSGFDETRREEAVEPAEARIGVREMRWQCADVAVGCEDFIQSGHVLAADRGTAQAGSWAAKAVAILSI